MGNRVARGVLRTVVALAAAGALAAPALAVDYRVTNDSPTVVYDAPSARARALYLYGKDVPVEVIVAVEGWTKVRDVDGTIGWIANGSLADRRELIVRTPTAEIRAEPEDGAPVVFTAEQNVLLDPAEPATSAAAAATPGWIKVRHRDGQQGYVRVSQVFGL